MNNSEKELLDIYHSRANHEDILHNSRTGIFLTFNSFMIIAVSITENILMRIIFAVIVLVINIFWIRWAPNARKFIRLLRDLGANRPDEVKWRKVIYQLESGINCPLTIISKNIPFTLALAWGILLILFIGSFIFRDVIKYHL